jgi:hypothetical protein
LVIIGENLRGGFPCLGKVALFFYDGRFPHTESG